VTGGERADPRRSATTLVHHPQIESDFLDSAFRLKSSAAMTSQSILLTGFQPSGILAMPAVETKQSDPARGNDGMPTFERELKSLHKAGGEQGGNISRQGQSRQARNQRRAEAWRQEKDDKRISTVSERQRAQQRRASRFTAQPVARNSQCVVEEPKKGESKCVKIGRVMQDAESDARSTAHHVAV
jgi:hypothetical protein